MSFREECRAAGREIDQEDAAIFDGVVDLAFESIVHGSPLTGAPGQPVRSGELRDSWETERPSATEARIATDHPAAPVIEDDLGNRHYRNHGPHSVKLTLASIDRIIDAAGASVRGGE
jgi:hypothetical protein